MRVFYNLYRRQAVRNSSDTCGVIDALVLIRVWNESILQMHNQKKTEQCLNNE